jgi:hypothetical protein
MTGVRTFLDQLPLLNTVAWVSGEVVHRPVDILKRRNSEQGRTQDLPLSPYDPPAISNPILTAYDITDFGLVNFVADPFLIPSDNGWHLFFEVYNQRRSASGAIGYARSTDNGKTWNDIQIVLQEAHHLSFPYVFKHDSAYYMLPEHASPSGRGIIRLYRAENFPTDWVAVEELLRPDHNADDTVIFEYKDRWWMICGDKEIDGLYVYYSDSLTGKWIPHSESPVVSDRAVAATPAGRPIVHEDILLMFYQDSKRRYGTRVRAYRLMELTPDSYVEHECPESPILEGKGKLGWRGIMHHIDAQRIDGEWVCAVDGNIQLGYQLFGQRHWAIGIFKS